MTFKKIIYFVVGLVLLILVAFIGYVKLNETEIKQNAIDVINNEIETEIEVNGKIDITFFSTFPKVSLTLHQVIIADKLRVNDTLAAIETLHVSFDAMNILRKNYTINAISLLHGKLNLYTDANGKSNFDVIKKNEGSTNEPTNIDLNFIRLQEINLTYSDKAADLYISSDIDNAVLAGSFSAKDFMLKADFDLILEQLVIQKNDYATNKNLVGNLTLDYQSESDCFTFKKGEVIANLNEFEVTGSICPSNESIDLLAIANGSDLKNILSLVPNHFVNNKQDVNGSGKYNIEAIINGKLKQPDLSVTFDLQNGNLTVEENDIVLNELNLNGSFNSKNKQSNQLKLDHYDFVIDNSKLSGSANFPNLKTPSISLNADGVVTAKTLGRLTNQNFLIETGTIELNNIIFSLNYLEADSIWKIGNIDGEILFDKLGGKIERLKQDFTIDGKLSLSNKKASADNLTATIGQNDLSFTGSLSDYLGYFQLQGIGSKSTLLISGNLSSNYFNLNDFLKVDKKIEESKIDGKTSIYKWLNLQGKVQLSIQEFVYLDFRLEKITADIIPKPSRLIGFNNVKANFKDGLVTGNIQTIFDSSNDMELNIDGKFSQIDIQELFTSFNNFGQTSITSKNLRGMLNAHILLTSKWKNLNKFEEKELFMDATISIENGELINLQSLQSLSGKLSVEQLEHLYFDELQSSILIKDRKINLPATDIKSNLLAMQISGWHSFDNEIDYSIKLNLKNLLAAKFKKKQTLKEDYVNNVTGGINLFISMTGTVENPKIEYDKKAVREKIKADFKDEKQELKDLFKKDNFEEPKNGSDYLYFEEDTMQYLDW